MAIKILSTLDAGGNFNLGVTDIPNLPANKITSGTFSIDRIPNLSSLYQPIGDYLTVEVADTTYQPIGNYLTSTSELNASRITSGTLAGARLPWDTSDGFSGTYSIVWRATDDMYTSSWLQVRGTDDALLTRKIVAGDNPIEARSIGFADAGLLFQDNDNYKCIHPTTMDGTAHNSSISLGWTNNKWKDGHFAGRLYTGDGNSSNWYQAYLWGDHAGLYDSLGSAGAVETAVNARIDEEILPAVADNATGVDNNRAEIAALGSAAVLKTGGTMTGTLEWDTSAGATNSHAKIIYGQSPSPDGTLNGMAQVANYGADGYGLLLHVGYGDSDNGGIKITDDGVVVWGASDENVFTVIDEDTRSERFRIDNAGNITASGNITTAGGIASAYLTNLGGAKLEIQNGIDGTPDRGIYMWNIEDPNWGIYMSTSGAGKSLGSGTATAGIDGATEHAIRFRVNDNSGQAGFIWENSSEVALMQMNGGTGHLYVNGRIYPSNQTTNYVDSTRIANWQAAYGWGNHAGLYDSAGSAGAVETALNARVEEELLPAIDAKLSKSGDTMTGNLTMSSPDPTLKFSINGGENNAGIVWEDGDAGDPSAQAAAIKWSAADNIMRFYNNDEGTERMRIATNGTVTIFNGLVPASGISGLTLSAGISGSNYNITGVNQLEINDPGEGIVFKSGSSGDITLSIVDDASDNRLNLSGTGASFSINNATVATQSDVNNTVGAVEQSLNERIDTEVFDAINSNLPLSGGTLTGGLKVNGIISSNNRTAINVAHWSETNNKTGAIKITLPGSHSSNWSMAVLRITTYEYSTNEHTVYYVSGHDWTSGWYNNRATIIGDTDKIIRFGYDSNDDYVIIGDVSSVWSYGHVTVDVMAHPSFYSGNMDISTGWEIARVQDLTGITIQNITNDKVANQSWVSSRGYATTGYVDTAVSNLVDSAPGALNTLNELAAALGDDANFSTTVTNNIGAVNDRIDAEVLPQVTSNAEIIDNNRNAINDLGNAIDDKLSLSGGTLSGDLTVGSIGRTSDTVVRSLADQSYKCGFEAYGNGQGTGYVYVGQSSSYGGGFSYNGDGSPGFIGGETADNITFFRRQAGSNEEVFHYAYNNNDVYFNGAVVASGSNSNNWNTAYNWGDHAGLYDSAGSANAVEQSVNERIDTEVFDAINTAQATADSKLGATAKAADSNLLDGINSSQFVRSDQNSVKIGRHLDADTTWTNSALTLFLGWYGGKVVIGNNNDGGHDYASALGGNTIPILNKSYFFKTAKFEEDIQTDGKLNVLARVGTWITSDVMADAIGWNINYGVYIGSNVGGTHYLRGNGTFTTGGSTYNLWHEGNFNPTDKASTESVAAVNDRIDTEVIPPLTDQDSRITTNRNEITTLGTAVAGKLDATAKAADSNLLDGLDSGVFMRKSANSHLDMNNYNISEVNHITLNDSGWAEGVQWQNWLLCDSPDDLSNSSGNFQIASTADNSIRVTVDTNGNLYPSRDRLHFLGLEEKRWQIVFCEILDSAGQHEKNLQNPEGEKSVGDYPTGTVLVWKGGKNIPCTEAADHMRMGIAVEGVASPLIQGAEPVLVTGKVSEGDYLVTSRKEGHAEAVSPEFMRQHGLYDCVIGKALENGDGESYLIKTWINI